MFEKFRVKYIVLDILIFDIQLTYLLKFLISTMSFPTLHNHSIIY